MREITNFERHYELMRVVRTYYIFYMKTRLWDAHFNLYARDRRDIIDVVA